jgi:hypothetical protein
MKRISLGCFEEVSIPALGVIDVIAKVDTGAYSGAVHCTDIRVVRRGVLRRRVLKFTPLGDPALATETEAFQRTYVRSATGHRLGRYIIDADIFVKGKKYMVKIGLSDRTDLKSPVLLGRRFLRENNMLVDVSVNQEYDDEGEATR